MLEFFRQYQRYFFLVITVVVVTSFTFFGAYSTFGGDEGPKDRSIGQTVHGSPLMLSEVQKLARFIDLDREEGSNLCNDGVIRTDFLKSQIGALLVAQYFDPLKEGFAARLDRAKRFRSYAHPETPFLSAKTVWEHIIPEMNEEIANLQAFSEPSCEVFSRLAKLYLLQNRLQPEMLRRILIYQHQQYPGLRVDQRLSNIDLSLFGFHSASDWFGREFVDLVAQFILNGASAAEEKGYRVTLEEAKGDLIHNFQESIQRLKIELNLGEHLRKLGFDERSAAEVWRKVLLFRKFFGDVGEAAFVDSMPYRDFASFARELAVVQKYEWPIQIATQGDLAQFEFYVKTISKGVKGGLPTGFLTVDEVEKKCPQLVQSKYKANVAEISKQQVALRASLKQVWDWETDEKNWSLLKKEFSLPAASSKEERFKVLERAEKRNEIDAFARDRIVDENKGWIDEALAIAPAMEKTWVVSGNNDPALKGDGMYYLVENLEKISDKQILPFNEARAVLAKLVKSEEGNCPKEKNPFGLSAKEALAAMQKNKEDSRFVQSGNDPLADQFKLIRKELSIHRNSKESWMKEQAFLMLPDLWSPIQVGDSGQVVFFYLQEKKVDDAPILDHLSFGKETLSADAKAYVAEKLIALAKHKNAIVIPVQNKDEE
jgi:hypothetical protein